MSDYCGWTLNQIKVELRRRGARASGRKADLVQRYVDCIEREICLHKNINRPRPQSVLLGRRGHEPDK